MLFRCRRWYEKLRELLEEAGFRRCESDHAVFIRCKGDTLGIITIHVDDMMIVASSVHLVQEIKRQLKGKVEISDLGKIHWLLGFEVQHNCSARTLSLSRKSYIDSVVKRYGLEDAKPLSTPMDPSACLSKAHLPSTPKEFADMRDMPYCEATGLSPMQRSEVVRTLLMPPLQSLVSTRTLEGCIGKLSNILSDI